MSGFPDGSVVKNPPAKQETQVQSLGWEDPMENEMTTHSSILAWGIPWTEEPGGLQSIGSKTVGHNLVKVPQSCLTLCDHMDYTAHEILQARILEWVAFPFSMGSSQPRDQTQVSTLKADSLPAESQGKPKNTGMGSLSLLQWTFPPQESK